MNKDSLMYSKEHEWVLIESKDTAMIGVTDFAINQLGDVVFIELPEIGTDLVQFMQLGEIESVKAVSELYSPIGGQVIEINDSVINNPALLNDDPYMSGWLLKVSLTDVSQTNNLMTHEEYSAFLASQTD